MSRAAKAPRGARPVQRPSATRPLACFRISRRDAIGVVMGSSRAASLKADFFSIVGENANVVQSADRLDAGQARLVLANKLRLNSRGGILPADTSSKCEPPDAHQ